MSQTYGIEAAQRASHGASPEQQPPARYLVLIDSAADGSRLARLFLACRTQVAEFDAAGPEVQAITSGLLAQEGACDPAWDQALAGHSEAERRQAQVFTLEV